MKDLELRKINQPNIQDKLSLRLPCYLNSNTIFFKTKGNFKKIYIPTYNQKNEFIEESKFKFNKNGFLIESTFKDNDTDNTEIYTYEYYQKNLLSCINYSTANFESKTSFIYDNISRLKSSVCVMYNDSRVIENKYEYRNNIIIKEIQTIRSEKNNINTKITSEYLYNHTGLLKGNITYTADPEVPEIKSYIFYNIDCSVRLYMFVNFMENIFEIYSYEYDKNNIELKKYKIHINEFNIRDIDALVSEENLLRNLNETKYYYYSHDKISSELRQFDIKTNQLNLTSVLKYNPTGNLSEVYYKVINSNSHEIKESKFKSTINYYF